MTHQIQIIPIYLFCFCPLPHPQPPPPPAPTPHSTKMPILSDFIFLRLHLFFSYVFPSLFFFYSFFQEWGAIDPFPPWIHPCNIRLIYKFIQNHKKVTIDIIYLLFPKRKLDSQLNV